MEEKKYKKLIAWQKADELAFEVYLATKSFPKDEIYGLTSQLRRAAISVPTNIVEGTGRQGKKELKRFVAISLGSLAETDYLLQFSNRLEYLPDGKYSKLDKLRSETGSLVWGLYKSL